MSIVQVEEYLLVRQIEAMRCFEEKIREREEISSSLFLSWRLLCQEVGKSLTDAAFCLAAKKYGAYILASPVNAASYAHFIRSDVQSKQFAIQTKTSREGIRSGFLEPKEKASPLSFSIQDQIFYAVCRDASECLVQTPRVSDELLQAGSYSDGSFIVSDVDLLSIALKEDPSSLLSDPTYGELTERELFVIEDINRSFKELLFSSLKVSSSFRLVAHGPASRFSRSKREHLRSPMNVYTPDGRAETIEEPFFSFHEKMKRGGYESPLNPNWGF